MKGSCSCNHLSLSLSFRQVKAVLLGRSLGYFDATVGKVQGLGKSKVEEDLCLSFSVCIKTLRKETRMQCCVSVLDGKVAMVLKMVSV